MWFSVCSVTCLNIWGKNEPCQGRSIARDNPNCWSIHYKFFKPNVMQMFSEPFVWAAKQRKDQPQPANCCQTWRCWCLCPNTSIVVMIFRAWVSPWCDDRWVWQEGTRALLCWQVLILLNSIICLISKDSVFYLLLPLSDLERTSGNCYSALAPEISLPMVSLMLDTGDDNVAHDGDLDAEYI